MNKEGRGFARTNVAFSVSTAAVNAMWAGTSRVMAASSTAGCSKDGSTGAVNCTLDSTLSSADLSTWLNAAQALNSQINSSSTIVITAFGGAGGAGDSSGAEPGGKAGSGGSAQMVTTLADLTSTYGTTKIYYYFGAQGSDDHPGGKGGAATIVAAADL